MILRFEILSVVFLIGMLVSGTLVIWGKRMISAVIASAAAGVFLMLLFFYLQAPDVALSEAAVSSVAVPMVMLVSIAKIRTLLEDPSEAE